MENRESVTSSASSSQRPKKFTQQQLFACLVLKNGLKTNYRGLVEYFGDCDSHADAIELVCIPHYTTFQKATRRLLLNKSAQNLIDETVRLQMQRRTSGKEDAIDSTGPSATSPSPYFVKRRATKDSPWKTITFRRDPKLGVVTDVTKHFILAFELLPAVEKSGAPRRVSLTFEYVGL